MSQEINVREKVEEIVQRLSEFKDALPAQFKDLEIEVKNWDFSVGKKEADYNVDVSLSLTIRAKKKQAES
jgi:hypothetical protein